MEQENILSNRWIRARCIVGCTQTWNSQNYTFVVLEVPVRTSWSCVGSKFHQLHTRKDTIDSKAKAWKRLLGFASIRTLQKVLQQWEIIFQRSKSNIKQLIAMLNWLRLASTKIDKGSLLILRLILFSTVLWKHR